MNPSLQLALGMTAFAVACCLLVTSLMADAGAKTAVLSAAVLSTGNGLCALLLTDLGARRTSTKAFFGAVFGGMVLRMGTTLGGCVVAIRVFHLPVAPFAATLLTLTALFTAAEVALWSRRNFSPKVQLS